MVQFNFLSFCLFMVKLLSYVVPVLLGQILAVQMAFATFFSSALEERGFQFPAFQNMPVYMLLSLCLFLSNRPSIPIWYYLILGFLDFEANFFIVSALGLLPSDLSRMTTIQILNSSTVPFVVLLSWVVLRKRFGWKAIGGMLVAVFGLAMVIGSEIYSHGTELVGKGVTFGLIAAFLYALCNCSEEWVLKRGASLGEAGNLGKTDEGSVGEEGPIENPAMSKQPNSASPSDSGVISISDPQKPTKLAPSALFTASSLAMLGFMGLGGFLTSFVQSMIIVRENIYNWWFSSANISSAIGFLAGYISVMTSFYLLLAGFLTKYDATFFNISILTAGVYSALIESIKKGELAFSYVYAIGFCMTLIGSGIYHMARRD